MLGSVAMLRGAVWDAYLEIAVWVLVRMSSRNAGWFWDRYIRALSDAVVVGLYVARRTGDAPR